MPRPLERSELHNAFVASSVCVVLGEMWRRFAVRCVDLATMRSASACNDARIRANPRFFTKNASSQPLQQLREPASLAKQLVGQGVQSLHLGAPRAHDDASRGQVVGALERLMATCVRNGRWQRNAWRHITAQHMQTQPSCAIAREDTRTSHALGFFFTSCVFLSL